MSRGSDLIAAIRAAYPTTGNTTWLHGRAHLDDNCNWNRIVTWFGRGSIGTAQQGAQARGDEWLWTRKPQVTFSIWATDESEAESRLHALLVAIEAVFGTTHDSIAELSEDWPNTAIMDGGCRVDLTCRFGLVVLKSDYNVVQDAADPGDGFPLTAIEEITLTPIAPFAGPAVTIDATTPPTGV